MLREIPQCCTAVEKNKQQGTERIAIHLVSQLITGSMKLNNCTVKCARGLNTYKRLYYFLCRQTKLPWEQKEAISNLVAVEKELVSPKGVV